MTTNEKKFFNSLGISPEPEKQTGKSAILTSVIEELDQEKKTSLPETQLYSRYNHNNYNRHYKHHGLYIDDNDVPAENGENSTDNDISAPSKKF